MSYVDGFVIPIEGDKLERYKQLAETACLVWKEHGALDYKECVVDDDNIEGVRSFAEMSGAGEGDTVIFSYIVFKSREHRDEVNEKVMADPRIKEGCTPEDMEFICKRMAYAGFRTIIEY